MKIAEIRLKNITELHNELSALLRAQFNLRIQRATQQLQNTSLLRKHRRDIARIHTVFSEKVKAK